MQKVISKIGVVTDLSSWLSPEAQAVVGKRPEDNDHRPPHISGVAGKQKPTTPAAFLPPEAQAWKFLPKMGAGSSLPPAAGRRQQRHNKCTAAQVQRGRHGQHQAILIELLRKGWAAATRTGTCCRDGARGGELAAASSKRPVAGRWWGARRAARTGERAIRPMRRGARARRVAAARWARNDTTTSRKKSAANEGPQTCSPRVRHGSWGRGSRANRRHQGRGCTPPARRRWRDT